MKPFLPLLALTATLLTAAKPAPPPPPVYGPIVPNMLPGAWEILYSKKVGPMYAYGTGWGFTMPAVPGYVGYVMQDCYGYIPVSSETQTVTMEATVDIIATPGTVFDANTSTANTSPEPAAVRFYVEYHWTDEYYVRWWATGVNRIVLANGHFEYSVPVDPAYWSDTWGQRADSSPAALAGWRQSFANVQRFGFTFGGKFYGHGARTSAGSASFNVSNIQIRTVSVP
tara:strand:- start:1744 stop:2424 length:681 start_codon:yes stop_codon:yes gene_type:complete